VLDQATGAEIDRGGPYLELSERTPMGSPFVSASARRNRLAITAIFDECGFMEYPYEFWHYSSGDTYEESRRGAGRRARYGPVDYDPVSGQMTPIEDLKATLNSMEEIMAEIRAALGRRQSKGQQR
jgi:hypothetical protein